MGDNPPPPTETIAFFGATGGCALAALTLALQKGYTCTALARTPSKLTSLLLARSIPQSTLDKNLYITEGSSKDSTAVLSVLTIPPYSPEPQETPPRPIDIVISGIGGKPIFWPNPFRPHLDDPQICTESAAVLLDALGKLTYPAGKKPLVVALSTTGIPGSPVRDVPLLLFPLYRFMLHHPHADKGGMEDALIPSGEARPNHPVCVVVKASLLTDGERIGVEKVRSGTEECPAVGYSISREDVGGWLFERVVENPGRVEDWGGKKVTVTY